jgi:two-component system, LytTR family, sensor kinase
MLQSANLRNPVLINSIGHSAGLLLFGLILFLLIRDWRAHGLRQTRLSLIAAALAFAWNVGSLVALGSTDQSSLFVRLVMTTSFSLLSLLPAVLLDVALQGRNLPIVAAGYLVSVSASLLHFSEVFIPDFELHQAALVLIAFGFGFLTIISFFSRRRSKLVQLTGIPEWISLTCLLLFTTSFLHFGYQHVSSPWDAEITWHHIGIPVVLIVLLQDYRFLLLDTFTRFLVNFGLASVYIAGLLLLNDKFRLWRAIQGSTFLTGISLVLVCVSLIAFAHLRNTLQSWMSRAIFRRRSAEECGKTISKLAATARSEEDLLACAAAEVARHLRTNRFAVISQLAETKKLETPAVLFRERQVDGSLHGGFTVEAQIPLRFSSGDIRFLTLGTRRGGRRYLSEDLEDMRYLGSVIVEQVERFRAEELKRLATQAELRALQAQINPHFLFNALNTLYGTIDRTSFEARRMVLNLADIFRYVLQGDRAVIQLSEELRIIQAYLEIEALRLGDRLRTELVIGESARSAMIPILSIQPLMENAVKHGISEKSGGGRVSLRAEKDSRGLHVTVEDTGLGFAHSSQHGSGASVGLENVRRRLVLYHGPEADLHIHSSSTGTKVSFFLPAPLITEPESLKPAAMTRP